MEKALTRVCEFYAITHRLKNLIRTGWKVWDITAERLESVAEHIYGTQMLAIAILSEFKLELSLERILLMLAVHELGETIIGDIPVVSDTPVTSEEKHNLEMAAIEKILEGMCIREKIRNAFIEFEEAKTPESKFARQLDKLDADFQVKYYQETGKTITDKPRAGIYKKLADEGTQRGMSLAKIWIEHDKEKFCYDELFLAIADFVADNSVF